MIDYKNKYLKYKLKYLQLKGKIFSRQPNIPYLLSKQTKELPKDSLRGPSESPKQLKSKTSESPKKLRSKTTQITTLQRASKFQNKYFDNAINLYKTYDGNCLFPEWVIDYSKWSSFNFDKTIVLYDKTDKLDDVKKLIEQRIPYDYYYEDDNKNTEIYNTIKLNEYFNYHVSYYRQRVNNLKPNIAIYCYASVKYNDDFINVHIINLVPYIFNNIKQPDFIYYQNEKQQIMNNGKDEKTANEQIKNDLILKYRKVWLKACFIAKYLRLNKIIIYSVGGQDGIGDKHYIYSRLLTREFNIQKFEEEIFTPSFYDNTIHPSITTPKSFCDTNNIEIQYAFNPASHVRSEPSKFFSNTDLKKTLFVNACNPHSILGNCNNDEKTINGFWGSNSNISVLGWGMTNDKIRYMEITY